MAKTVCFRACAAGIVLLVFSLTCMSQETNPAVSPPSMFVEFDRRENGEYFADCYVKNDRRTPIAVSAGSRLFYELYSERGKHYGGEGLDVPRSPRLYVLLNPPLSKESDPRKVCDESLLVLPFAFPDLDDVPFKEDSKTVFEVVVALNLLVVDPKSKALKVHPVAFQAKATVAEFWKRPIPLRLSESKEQSKNGKSESAEPIRNSEP